MRYINLRFTYLVRASVLKPLTRNTLECH